MRLEGKVALISGAAMGLRGELMGFGGASAWLFAGEGARVVLGDIDDSSGETSASQLREEGFEAVFVHLDVTREADWEAAVRATIDRFGRLDILVNSAGTAPIQRTDQTTPDIWRRQMDVHAKGVWLGMKHSAPEMRRAGGGSIVNISSVDALTGGSGGAAYSAAKGASRSITKVAAMAYAKDGIRVNSVHPGYSQTPLAQIARRDLAAAGIEVESGPGVPMGRSAAASEIANGILFLASQDASYVTAAELVIDGGLTSQ